MNTMLTIGIVIYNEENQLQRVEQNLALLRAEAIAVILVDNASTDNSLKHLTELSKKYGARLLGRSQNQMGAARAQLVSEAQTPWVGFIDADCEISREWVKALLSLLHPAGDEGSGLSVDARGDISALGGPLLPGGSRKLLFQRLFKSFLGNMNSAQVKNFAHKELVAHLPTANVVYRRQDILDLGNFDLSKTRVGEDLEMSYRLSEVGKKMQMDPALALNHYMPSSFFIWLKKIFHYGRARGQVGVQYNVVGTYPFMLPLLFFAFLVANIAFFSQWQGLPFYLYLAFVLFHSLYYGKNLAAVLFGYFLGTHLAYSCGMVIGICEGLSGSLGGSRTS